MSSHKQFDHLRIPLEEIVSATDNFSDANFIRHDGFGKEYKGQLLQSGRLVDIVARRLDDKNGIGIKEFWMEVSMLCTLEHQNIVSIVGFCDDGDDGEKIVINKRESTRGSVCNYLRDPSFTWMRRLRICVGVARALNYIHYDEGRDFGVIHRDIKSSKILLDDNWEAKLSGFELSMNQAAAERNCPCQLSGFCGTVGYMDPTYFKTGSVSHKSDMFSFGVVLIEVLCGKVTEAVNEGEDYLYELAKSHIENGRLYDMVNPGLWKQMDPQSFKIFSEIAYCCLKAEPSERPSIDQILIQLEKALESQQEQENHQEKIEGAISKSLKLAHLQIPLEEIVSATNNFSDANLIGRDGFGKEYKGQLLGSHELVNIVARRYFDDNSRRESNVFFMEVSMLSKLKHKNLVSIIGFCDENGEKIVINKHESRGNLYDYLRDPTLTWMRRLQICVGAAHALSYIYYDKRRDFSIIHRDIKSSKILLDEQWEAKLSGFELSITQTASRRDRLCVPADVCGTIGYRDPTYVQSGIVTHKSDIYSFGIVLFEVLCGKHCDDDKLLAPSARSYYEEGRLEDMIDPVLWKQMDPKSFKIFSETAYYCVKEQRQQRPNIHQIVIQLEKALEFQWKHQNPDFISKAHSMVKGMTSKSLKGKNLKHLEIPLIDIQLATENFGKTYPIGSGGYGDVYKAELDHFDSKNLLPLEEKKTREHAKKRSTVAIKRILNREDKQGIQGFLAEIEMLTNCKHPNIISLLGFCKEGDHMLLVYEHASKGSLSDYLGSTGGKLTNLSWVQRIKICIDIARGLNYLHTKIEDDRRIIHRDIKSDNILLTENWQAKIADFGLSRLRSVKKSQQVNKTLNTETRAGTDFYWDPEYFKTGRLKNESDIYSFGVVLFEILSGKLANDEIYTKENINGIAPVARRRFNEGTIREMVDPKLMEETHDNIFTSSRGPDKDSLDTFTKIAYQCVAESQTNRPTAEVIIKELEEALSLQENIKDHLQFSLDDIKTATQDFSQNNLIGSGAFGNVYKGEVMHANGRNAIAAKRWDASGDQGEHQFLMELQILLEYKHENCIGLLGYCNEMGEKIIVYEYASRGSLDRYLKDKGLMWMKRLEICIDIASGLDFLHGGGAAQEPVMHRDIKSANVLLTNDWKGKISDFGVSLISPLNKDIDFVFDNACGTRGYVDPLYLKLGFLTKESDIYSLGVVLFEILSGRDAYVVYNTHGHLSVWVKNNFNEGKLDEMVFEGIKEQIAPKSLATFQMIAYQCLHDDNKKRPTSRDVLLQLKKSLEFQEDYEIWERKLPDDYEQIFKISNFSEIYSTKKKKDLHNLLSTGIILQKGTVWFSIGANGERNEMISAWKFLYKQRQSHKWGYVPQSRFQKVAEMLDFSNLKIKMKIKTQLLSSGVNYGIHLIFRICGPRKSLAKQMYVNLKYKKGRGSETLHAYFATWREDDWMMIELCRFSNDKENIDLEFLLESLSRYYCGSHGIYVEGIEFRAIDNVKHEETDEIQEVQQVLKSDSNMNLMQQLPTNLEEIFKRSENEDGDEKLFLLNEVNGKRYLMLSAKAALYNYSDVKLFKTKPSIQSRFLEVIELLSQQVLRINCKIKSQMLSRDTDYTCYLVFKLSEKCRGLHCPVKVRNLLHRNKKEVGIIYFRTPNPWNLHDTNQAPQQRPDGWMEVKVWKFNLNHELIKNDSFRVNLKLISYEGTLSGLILCGLEFRPL